MTDDGTLALSVKYGVCAAPCHYGGAAAARKYSKADLGLWGRCNRRTQDGQQCWQHRTPSDSLTDKETP